MKKLWTTTYNTIVVSDIMEFQGPRIKANSRIEADKIASNLGVTLSDIHIKPPLLIRIKILYSKLKNLL